VTHFTAEEGIQRKYNYPKYPAHKLFHTGFIADIQSMKNDIIKNGVTIASGAMVGMALSNWLVTHINVEDKALGTYIRSVDAGK
jgi:hemerythrin